jgi:hypothetical protein
MIKKIKKTTLIALSVAFTFGILGCGGGGGGSDGAVPSAINWAVAQKPTDWSSPTLQGFLKQVGGDREALLVPPMSPDNSNASLWVISPLEKSLVVLTVNAINASTLKATGRQYDLSSNFGSTSIAVDLEGSINTNTNPASLIFTNSTVYSFEDNLQLAALQLNLRGDWKGVATGELGHEISLSIDEAGIITKGETTQGHIFSGQILARNDIRAYQVKMRAIRGNKRFSINGVSLIVESNSRLNLMWVLTDLDTGETSAASYSLTRQ